MNRVLDESSRLSRRWFLAGGAGAVAAAGVGGWRWLATEEPQAQAVTSTGDGLVAVIPVDGAGELLDDPWRVALTVDIHDALSTTGLQHLSLDVHPAFETLDGTAVQLSRKPDPSAAAWKLDGVVAVVRMAIGSRVQELAANGPLAIDVTIERRATRRWTRRFERPAREVLLLVHDLATALALQLGRAKPRRFLDVQPLDAPTYAAYGAGLATLLGDLGGSDAEFDAKRAPLAAVFAANETLHRAGARVALRIAQSAQLRETDDVLPLTAEAIRISDRILASDPDQPIALAARGVAASTMYDWKTVERTLPRALEIAPTLHRIAQTRAVCLLYQGKFEEHDRVAAAHRARNPLVKGKIGPVNSLFVSRRYLEEIRYIESILDSVYPAQRRELLSQLALAYAYVARFDKAVAIADQLADSANPVVVTAYALAGQRDKAIALRAKIIADGATVGPIALMEDALGNTDAALVHLENIVAKHYTEALYLKVFPYSSALRSQPRFQALMKTVGL